jgi:formylglycine-generating enzyme required for sulfatase activity
VEAAGESQTGRGVDSGQEGTWSDTEILKEDQDRFSFRDYAQVLTDRAITADTPLTIGIFGRWGSGKSSLMRLTDAALTGEGREQAIHSIWINVWQLSNQDEVWQAFLQALFSKVHDELGFWQRVDKLKLASWLASNILRLALALTPLLLGLLLGTAADLDEIAAEMIARGGLLASLGLMVYWVARINPIVEAARETVKFDLGAVLKEGPYEEQVSELMELQDRFANMVKLLVGDDGRLVVFIDDLDRCAPDKVPEVLEAIKLFTTTPGCVYVIGLDHDIVRQGIETKYAFKTTAAASEYLEKIVQIPFFLPPLDEGRIEEFVREYYPDLREESPTAAEVFSEGLEPNPRKVKRALNIYRTLLELSRVRVRAWEMDPVDPELVAKMVVIESRFRRLHNYLVRRPAFLLELEEKALSGNGLNREELEEERVGVVLLGDRPKQAADGHGGGNGLIDAASLGALNGTLRAGERRFNDEDQRNQITSYIFLIATTEGTAEQIRPNRREREALLGGDRTEIRDQVDEILARGEDQPARQRIGEAYIERLEGVLEDAERYTPPEQASAGFALALMELSLLGGSQDDIEAYVAAYQIRETRSVQTAGEPEKQEGRQKAQLKSRMMLLLDGSGNWDADQILTANSVLDVLEGLDQRPFEPQMLRIPAEPFLMGSTEEELKKLKASGVSEATVANERPQHVVELGDFLIGRTPVTNAQYQVFVQETGHESPEHWEGSICPPDTEAHPVVNVSWLDAQAYCGWLSRATGLSYGLPSEAEWEKAARGVDGRVYPWGDEFDPTLANTAEQGPGGTSAVGAFPGGASPYGVLDMSGNVWEWTSSIMKPYFYVAGDGRESLEVAEAPRVVRGGSWDFNLNFARAAFRLSGVPFVRDGFSGFRLLRRSPSR